METENSHSENLNTQHPSRQRFSPASQVSASHPEFVYQNTQAREHARQHNGNVYNTTTNNHVLPSPYHLVPTKPADHQVHADLIRACAEGQTRERLNRLIGQGADIDHRDKINCTPLHHAAFEGREGTVRYLIDAGADMHAVDMWLGTPLCLAAAKGHVAAVNIFIQKKKANLNQRCEFLGSAMHTACIGKSMDVARALIDAGVTLNTTGITCIRTWEFLTDPGRTLPSFIRPHSGDQVSLQQGSPIALAVSINNYPFLAFGLNLENTVSASEVMHTELDFKVTRDISLPAQLSSTYSCSRTLLAVAADALNVDMLGLLLAKGADAAAVSTYTLTAVIAALPSWSGAEPEDIEASMTCLSLLASHGADLDEKCVGSDRTALICAAGLESADVIVEHLLDLGASVNIVDINGRSALFHAVSHKWSDSTSSVVRLLCERGADVHLRDSEGYTVLEWAHLRLKSETYREVEEILLSFGAPKRAPKVRHWWNRSSSSST